MWQAQSIPTRTWAFGELFYRLCPLYFLGFTACRTKIMMWHNKIGREKPGKKPSAEPRQSSVCYLKELYLQVWSSSLGVGTHQCAWIENTMSVMGSILKGKHNRTAYLFGTLWYCTPLYVCKHGPSITWRILSSTAISILCVSAMEPPHEGISRRRHSHAVELCGSRQADTKCRLWWEQWKV